MKKKSNKRKSIGLPGGPNEFINYAPQLFSTEGYKTNSPDVNNLYNIIPSGDITMKGVDFPVMGTDNLGNQQLMQPGFDYKFPGDIVFEEPRQYKKGGEQNTINKYGRSLPKFQSKGQVNEPLFGTQEQIDSYADSLNLYNAYKFQINNSEKEDSDYEQVFDIYKGSKSKTNNFYKSIKDNTKEAFNSYDEYKKASADFAFFVGEYPYTWDKLIKEEPYKSKYEWTKSAAAFKNTDDFQKLNIKNDYDKIKYYESLKFSNPNDVTIGRYSSADIGHRKIKPVDSYWGGKGYNPIYKKPVQPYILDTRDKLEIQKLPIKTSPLPVDDLPTEIIYPTREYTPPPPPPTKLEQMQDWMKNIDLGDWSINTEASDGSAGTSFNPDLYNHYRNQRKAFSKGNPFDFINPAVIGAYPTDKDGRRGRFLGLFNEGGSLPEAQWGALGRAAKPVIKKGISYLKSFFDDAAEVTDDVVEKVVKKNPITESVANTPKTLDRPPAEDHIFYRNTDDGSSIMKPLDFINTRMYNTWEAPQNLSFFSPNNRAFDGYGANKFGAKINPKKPFYEYSAKTYSVEDVQKLIGQGYDAIVTNYGKSDIRDAYQVIPLDKSIITDLQRYKELGGESLPVAQFGALGRMVKPFKQKAGEIRQYNPPGFFENLADILASPMTSFGYSARNQNIPKGLNVNNPERNAFDSVIDMINPFAWKQYAENASDNVEKGEYLDATFDALSAIPIVPAWMSKGKNFKGPIKETIKKVKEVIKPTDDMVEVFTSDGSKKLIKKTDAVRLNRIEDANVNNKTFTNYEDGNWFSDEIQPFYLNKSKNTLNGGFLNPADPKRVMSVYLDPADAKLFDVSSQGTSVARNMSGGVGNLPIKGEYVLPPDLVKIMREGTSGPGYNTMIGNSESIMKNLDSFYKKLGGGLLPKAQEGEETKGQLMFDQDFYNNQRSDRTGNNSSYELENKKLKNKHQEEEAVFTDINKVLRWQRQGLYAPDETFIDPQSGREVPANIGSMSSWDFEDKYGTSLHAMRNTYDKAYVDYMSSPERQKAISKFGTIKSQRQSNLDNMGNNPNSQWIVGASNQQYGTPEQKANTAALHNNVIGAVVPIPGLQALKLTKALKLPGLIDDAVLPAISKVFKGQGTLKSNVTSYYHGSPWRWEDDLFDASMIGKGEGATKRMQGLNLFPEGKLHVVPKFANIKSADAPLYIGSSNKIEQSLLDELNPTIYKFDDIGNKLKLKEVSGRQIKNLKQEDLINEGFDGIRTQGQITVFPSSVNKLTKSSAQSIEGFVKANPNVKNWVKWTTNPKEFERITGLKLTAKELEELKEATKQLPGSGNVDEIMSLKAPKGNMYGQNQVLTQQQRLLNPDIKNKFFEHQAPVSGPKENKFQKMFKDYNNRITPENYDDFVKNIHGSTDYNLAKTTGKQPHNLGIGNYGKPGMVYSDAPLNNLGKDIINAHEKNHGMFAGTLSKEMSDDLLKPFGTNKPIPHYALKHQADEVFGRMGQFKNAVGIGDNQTFTLGHLNLIRKNYAKSFLDNDITEMLKKIKPGSAGEKEFLTNMNKYAFGLAPAAIIGAASQMGPKQEDGQFKYGGDLLKAQNGEETNGVKYGTSEYADAYYNLGDGKGGNLLYPSGDPTVAGMKYLPEVKINTFSDGINYPYFDYLTKEEKSLFRNEGPIGSSLRAKALYGYGINGNQTYMDSVDDFVLTASGIPQTLTALQIPQSLLTESLAMAKGEDYNMSDAFGGFTGGKQRYPSDVIGFEDKPGWDIGGSANTVMDILVDPTNWLGVGLLNKFSKANKLKKLDNVGNINLSTYEPTLEAMANRLDEMNDALSKALKNSGSKAEKDAAAEIWAEINLDEIIAMRKLTDKMPKSKLSSEIREKLKDIDIGDGGSQIKKTDLEVHINSKTGEIEQFHSLNKGKVTQQDLDENLPWYLSNWGGAGSHNESSALWKRSKKLPPKKDSNGFIDMDDTNDRVQSWGPWKNKKGGETLEGRSLPKAQLGNYIPSWANPKNWGVTNRDNDGTFKQAFDNSVVAGEEEFMWNDKRYATKTDILDSKDSDRVEDYNLNIYDNLSDIEKARREDIFSAINTVLEHESDKENTANLKRLLTLTAVMENTLGVDETAYSRDYTRGPMSIDDIAYKDLFEFLPKMKNYTKSQLKHFKWLENLGYDYKDMDKILSSDDPIAGIAAARMMYARSPDPIPDAKNSRELFDYWVKHYNRGGIEKHGGAEKHFKKWNQFYKDLYTYDKGGEINELEMYRNYVEGVYNNTKIEKKAEKLYDKYNRIYYKDAKALNMSPANYILTHKMDKA